MRVVVYAVVAAVLGALSGIALGSWVGWRGVEPRLPDEPTTIGVARTVLPGPFDEKVFYYVRQTFWNPYSNNTLHGGTGVRAGRAAVTGTVPPGTGYRQLAAAVREHMRANGWQDVRVEEVDTWPAGQAEVTGTRAGYLVAVQVRAADQTNPAAIEFNLMWAEPPGHLRDTILGGLAGALLGAALAFGTTRRMQRLGRQRSHAWLSLATLVLLTPACLGNIPTSTGSALSNTNRNGTGPSVYWGGFVIYGAEPLAMLSIIPILAILVLCFWPHRTTEVA